MQRAHHHEINIPCVSLGELFDARVSRAPDTLAYAFVHDDLRTAVAWTRADLERRVRTLAAALRGRIEPGERALLLYAPGLEFVRAFWACVVAGVVPVPVATLDAARLSAGLKRLRAIGADARARWVLCDRATRQHVDASGDAATGEQWLVTDTIDHADGDGLAHSAHSVPGAVAYLQYTSGATAAPRGVRLSHANVLANCGAMCDAVDAGADDKALSWLPHFHDFGLLHGIVAPLYAGIPAYLMSPITFLRRPLRWLDAIGHFGITLSGAPDFAYAACVTALENDPTWHGDLQHWRVASCGAEPIRAHTAQSFSARFAAQGLAATAFAPAYGMAEVTLLASIRRHDQPWRLLHVDRAALAQGTVQTVEAHLPQARALVGCGEVLGGHRIRVIDPVTLRACAPDVVGELWITGPSTGLGYEGQEQATLQVFGHALADEPGASFLRSGDLGFMRDGEVYVTGRLKDLLIVNGRNIHPHDVEWTAQHASTGLRKGYGAAFAIDGDGGEQAVLVQEVERKHQRDDLAAMAAAIRQAVAMEHELPLAHVVLVRAGSVPRTSSGKLQRSQCRVDFVAGRLQPLWQADAAAPLARADATGGSLPTLIDLVAALAHTSPLAVDPGRSLIENGLDSLRCFQLANRVESIYGVSLAVEQLLGRDALSALADAIDATDPIAVATAIEVSSQPALSAQQADLWTAEQVAGPGLYNVARAFDVRGAFDARLLEQTLQALVERHDALRLSFSVDEATAQPMQRVADVATVPFEHVDLQTLAPERRQTEVARVLEGWVRRPFELHRAPLLRALTIALAPDEHVLALAVHHLVFDGWSATVLLREWSALIQAQLRHQAPPTWPPAGRFLAHAAAEARWLRSEAAQQQRSFWRARLAGVPVLRLPFAPTATTLNFEAGVRRFTIAPDALAAAKQLAAREHTTLFVLLMAALQTLLHRYSGQDDFALATPVAGRLHERDEHAVGMYANTLVLRADLSGEPVFSELMARVHRHAIEAYAHQALPYPSVLAALERSAEERRAPLFNIVLALHSMAPAELHWPGADVRERPQHNGATRTDLWFDLTESAQGLRGEVEFNRARLTGDAVDALVRHFEVLLQAALREPARAITTLDVLGTDERQAIVFDRNATARDYPLQWCMHELIEQQVRRTPQAVAASLDAQSLTYDELDRRANRLARRLQSLGVGRGVHVGVCLPRTLHLPVAVLAVFKAGGVYVPMDPELPTDRLAFLRRDADAAVVLTLQSLLGLFESARNELKPVVLAIDHDTQWALPDTAPDAGVTPDDPAYVIYTSGSTGQPKGVVVNHRAMCNHKHWEGECIGLALGHRVLQKATISFDASLFELLAPLCTGAQVVLARPGGQRDSGYLVRKVREHDITHLVLTPSAARALLEEPELARCTSLQHLIFGGEALDWELVRRCRALLPRARIGNFYGPSETTEDATHHDVGEIPGEAQGTVPIGRPMANVRCHVLDAHLQPVPDGVVGELCIGGIGVARYHNRPQLQAERFVADPFHPGERLYHTGDLARYLPDGTIEFIGRADAQVKLRGVRIEPGEIEAALQRIDGVRACAVVPHGHAGGSQVLVAYLVADARPPAQWRERLRASLPDYMVPAIFVALPALPLLPNGKVDRAALPPPDALAGDAPAAQPAGTLLQQQLQRIVADVLERPLPAVDDNFFELGGDSLSVTRVVSRLRAQLRIELPLRALFDHPSIAALAAHIESGPARDAAGDAPIAALPRDGALPVSFSQRRMWLVQQMDPDGAAYNMPFACRIRGALDTDLLGAALRRVVTRHEAFRTRFELHHDEPVQYIDAHATLAIDVHDLRGVPATEREPRAHELLRAQARQPFDLRYAPLARVALLRLADDEHVLLLVMHHVIGDQWSGGIVARELARIYDDLRARRTVALPALPLQPADHAAWQRVHLRDDALAAQQTYWRAHLAGMHATTLPTDIAPGNVSDARGASLTVPLADDSIAAIEQLATTHGATLFMVTLAVFQLMLARYSGGSDIAVGTPIANRTRADTEAMVATMVNTLVMRTAVDPELSFSELLARVRDTALQAYAHQDLPYETLVDSLRDGGAAAANVRILFNVLNAPWHAPTVDALQIEPFEFDRGATQFDLTLTIDAQLDRRLHIEYASALYHPDTVQRLATHYLNLLRAAAAQPHVPIGRLAMVDALERQQLLQWANPPATPLPAGQRVDQWITVQAARDPLARALTQHGHRVGYAELDRRANRLAHHLQRAGLGRGALVGIALDRSPSMVIALLAVMKSGAAYLPLDPSHPAERLSFIVADSGAAAVLCSGAARPPWLAAGLSCIALDTLHDTLATESAEAPDGRATLDDLAYVLYTSGSTGRPKGVEVTHRNLLNFIASMQMRPGCAIGDTMLAVTTLSFDIAGLELLLPLTVGAQIEIATRDEAIDARLLIERMDVLRPTLMQATPTTWRMLIEAGWAGDARLTVLCGGEPLAADLAARLRTRCGALWNLYGPTETTIWSTLDAVQPDAPISIGRPIANTSVHVLDALLQPVPVGVAGELCIGGLGVARGYRHRPELTAQRFVDDPFSDQPGARLYRTGDLAKRLPDGRLVHLGRNDFQVKVRGHRIELGEIESALSAHESVAHAAVAARPDASGQLQLVAYVVPRGGATVDTVVLRAHLRSALPDSMVPSHVVAMTALPLTANRKVDLHALPAPRATDVAAAEPEPSAPQGMLAVQLLALWRQVLGDDTLGLHDDFFERGGHSLKAVQLLAQVEHLFGRRLPLATLVEAPTVARLEQVLGRADWTPPWRSLVALSTSGERTPLFMVPGVGGNVLVFSAMARLLDGERPVYGLQARGLDGIAAPFRSIVEMATHYVAEVRSMQPAGPYLLMGACTGGMVAYEMAHQLRHGGSEVELIIVETWHPTSFRTPSAMRRTALHVRFMLKAVRATARTLLRSPPPQWSAALHQLVLKSDAVSTPETLLTEHHDYLGERVVAATLDAVAGYQARPYSGTLLNVIAAERPIPDSVIDTRRHWEPLAQGGARSAELAVAGSGTMFWQPYVGQLTTLMRDYLGRRL